MFKGIYFLSFIDKTKFLVLLFNSARNKLFTIKKFIYCFASCTQSRYNKGICAKYNLLLFVTMQNFKSLFQLIQENFLEILKKNQIITNFKSCMRKHPIVLKSRGGVFR